MSRVFNAPALILRFTLNQYTTKAGFPEAIVMDSDKTRVSRPSHLLSQPQWILAIA
jgi:hypothetical protein